MASNAPDIHELVSKHLQKRTVLNSQQNASSRDQSSSDSSLLPTAVKNSLINKAPLALMSSQTSGGSSTTLALKSATTIKASVLSQDRLESNSSSSKGISSLAKISTPNQKFEQGGILEEKLQNSGEMAMKVRAIEPFSPKIGDSLDKNVLRPVVNDLTKTAYYRTIKSMKPSYYQGVGAAEVFKVSERAESLCDLRKADIKKSLLKEPTNFSKVAPITKEREKKKVTFREEVDFKEVPANKAKKRNGCLCFFWN